LFINFFRRKTGSPAGTKNPKGHNAGRPINAAAHARKRTSSFTSNLLSPRNLDSAFTLLRQFQPTLSNAATFPQSKLNFASNDGIPQYNSTVETADHIISPNEREPIEFELQDLEIQNVNSAGSQSFLRISTGWFQFIISTFNLSDFIQRQVPVSVVTLCK